VISGKQVGHVSSLMTTVTRDYCNGHSVALLVYIRYSITSPMMNVLCVNALVVPVPIYPGPTKVSNCHRFNTDDLLTEILQFYPYEKNSSLFVA